MQQKIRIGITGLPGSGKTILASRIAQSLRKYFNQYIPCIHGDHVLPININNILSILDSYIVEHFQLCKFLLYGQNSKNFPFITHLLIIRTLKEKCIERCFNRKNHSIPSIDFCNIETKMNEEILLFQNSSPQILYIDISEDLLDKILFDAQSMYGFLSELFVSQSSELKFLLQSNRTA